MKNYYYECDFLYVSDTSRFSANIPDAFAFSCLIKSDVDLKDIPKYMLFDDIQKYLDDDICEIITNHDCDTVRMEEINEEELSNYDELKLIEIDKIDTGKYKSKEWQISKE